MRVAASAKATAKVGFFSFRKPCVFLTQLFDKLRKKEVQICKKGAF